MVPSERRAGFVQGVKACAKSDSYGLDCITALATLDAAPFYASQNEGRQLIDEVLQTCFDDDLGRLAEALHQYYVQFRSDSMTSNWALQAGYAKLLDWLGNTAPKSIETFQHLCSVWAFKKFTDSDDLGRASSCLRCYISLPSYVPPEQVTEFLLSMRSEEWGAKVARGLQGICYLALMENLTNVGDVWLGLQDGLVGPINGLKALERAKEIKVQIFMLNEIIAEVSGQTRHDLERRKERLYTLLGECFKKPEDAGPWLYSKAIVACTTSE